MQNDFNKYVHIEQLYTLIILGILGFSFYIDKEFDLCHFNIKKCINYPELRYFQAYAL